MRASRVKPGDVIDGRVVESVEKQRVESSNKASRQKTLRGSRLLPPVTIVVRRVVVTFEGGVQLRCYAATELEVDRS